MSPWLTVVGIGEDGFKGLGRNARHALLRATQIIGAQRQLDLLPVCIRGAREVWPSPFSLEPVLARRFEPVCVLASGDPMFYGVGASLARQVAADELLILPAPSSVSLAAARVGWPLQDVVTLSVVARPLAALKAHLASGVRLLVLSNELFWLVAGDHDLKPLKASGFSHQQHLDAAADQCGIWLVASAVCELGDLVVDRATLLHELADLLIGVHHRGVVAVAEQLPDFRQREVGELTTQVHRDLTSRCDGL